MSVGLLIHIPHASLYIPEEYKDAYLISPEELTHEAQWSADIYCDELFGGAAGKELIARHSRLVCDVERFRDDEQEIKASEGNGLYYTRTIRGKPLRNEDNTAKEKVLAEIYDPHHELLTQYVNNILLTHNSCLIIDGHSFGDDEMHGENLPDFCIGTDNFHTPQALEKTAHALFNAMGYSTESNRPFAGAITPLVYYKKDKRVMSIMIEVNKRLYVKEDRIEKTNDFEKIRKACQQAIQALLACSVQL